MFNWFKKKKNKDEELKAKLAEKLKDYAAPVVEDTTDTTFTDVEISPGVTVKVPKINAKAIEELTLTEFEEDVTVVGLDAPKDPWSVNLADTTQWHRAEKHGRK
jgi:hypothetical protein